MHKPTELCGCRVTTRACSHPPNILCLREYGIKQQPPKTPCQMMRKTTEGMRTVLSKFSSIRFIFEDFIFQQVPPLSPLKHPLHCFTI